MSFPIPDLYYPMNICDTNLNPTKQLVNWASGKPVYDASLNSAYISTKNYQCGLGSAEFPKNEITGFGAATITSCVNQTHGIAVSQDQLKMITCNRISAIDQMSYATRTSITSTWSTFTQFGVTNRDVWYYRCSLTADGKRGVICSCSSLTNVIGRVYFFTWTSTTPSAPVLTLDTINRYYRGVAITPDGSRLVACADTSVFFATWDANNLNYTTFTQTIDTATYTTGTTFEGICISNTGDRIVYGDSRIDQTSSGWYISYWNGTNYDQSIMFRSVKETTTLYRCAPRSACFSADASILFLSYFNDLSGSIQYGTYDSLLNTYSNFKYISTTLIPANLDVHGLCYVDGITRGYLYASGAGTALMYTIPVSYAYSVVGTIGTVTTPLVTIADFGCNSIAVSQNQLRMIISGNNGIYYSSRANTDVSWITPTKISTSITKMFVQGCITADGTRGVASTKDGSQGGNVYFFAWPISNNPNPIIDNTTSIISNISGDYYALAMTPDGSRVVTAANNTIYLATWNETIVNYSAFTPTLESGVISTGVRGLSISSDGDRIVYGSSISTSSTNWYLAVWNGTNYSAGTVFNSKNKPTVQVRSSYFSTDASILYLSYALNVTGSIEYGTYNPASKTYDNFTYIPTSKIPASMDTHGLCVVDSISGGSLYAGTWGNGSTLAANTYSLQLSYDCSQNADVIKTFGTATSPISSLPGSMTSYVGIAVSQNQLRMIFCGNPNSLFSSYRLDTNSQWTVSTNHSTAGSGIYMMCGLTDDGTRGVACNHTTGNVFCLKWPLDSVAPNSILPTTDISRSYRGVAITPDGSRMVASTASKIYFATWDVNTLNYSTFTVTPQTSKSNNSDLFGGISISSDGNRIVYGEQQNSGTNWYIAYWNGANYNAGITFNSGMSGVPRASYFSADASILYLSYTANLTGSIQYGTYNKKTLLYDNFKYISTTKLPASLDTHGLCVVDSIIGGSIYVATWGGTVAANTYCLPFSYNTNYVALPAFKTGENGFTIATWFRSNNNQSLSRIFDFGSDTLTDSIHLYIDASGCLRYDQSNNEQVILSSNPINDNTWHHIAITSAYAFPGFRASHVIIYLDGASVSETSEMFNYFDISCTSNYIGKSNWSINPPFYGNIDDFRFYKRVLTSAQITQLYTKDSTINHFVDCKNCTVYRISDYNTTLKVDVPWGLTTAMGTTTYYYWIDPYAASNAYMNRPNPIRFSYTYDNSTNLTSAKLYVMADDFAEIFINNSYIYSFGGWTIADTSFSTVPLRSGSNTFQFNCINSGGPAMLAVYVTDSIGNVLFNTNYTTSGWTAIHTGFFTKNIPLTSYIRNNSSQTASTTSVASTKFMVGTNTPKDISNNKAISGISPYSTLGYFTATNTDLANIFYTNLK